MIDSVPLIQNANDAQQINASIIALKKASRELDEKIAQFNKLLSQEITNREKAITEAINSLDVPGVGGSGKYISAISETDGKISATESDITSTVSSGNSQPVTSGGVAEAILNNTKGKVAENLDLNTYLDCGLYVSDGDKIYTNAPENNFTYFALLVLRTAHYTEQPNDVFRNQIIYKYNYGTIYVRSYVWDGSAMAWTAWNKVVLSLTDKKTPAGFSTLANWGIQVNENQVNSESNQSWQPLLNVLYTLDNKYSSLGFFKNRLTYVRDGQDYPVTLNGSEFDHKQVLIKRKTVTGTPNANGILYKDNSNLLGTEVILNAICTSNDDYICLVGNSSLNGEWLKISNYDLTPISTSVTLLVFYIQLI